MKQGGIRHGLQDKAIGNVNMWYVKKVNSCITLGVHGGLSIWKLESEKGEIRSIYSFFYIIHKSFQDKIANSWFVSSLKACIGNWRVTAKYLHAYT